MCMLDKLSKFFKAKVHTDEDKQAAAGVVPKHIGIIMDGNGRWAKNRGLSRSVGHRFGGEALRKITRAASELGVSYLTVYAFSTENWKRPADEVRAIMAIFLEFFARYREELRSMDCRVRFMGSRDNVPEDVLETIILAESESAERQGIQLIVAFNYGGRQEIVDAVKHAVETAGDGADFSHLDEESFRQFLYLPDVPDPDLIIRSSGEMRMSNFLIWEAAYSELWVTDVLWPDFAKEDLQRAISDYNSRNRRYGGV